MPEGAVSSTLKSHAAQTIETLRKLGTAQNIKVFSRHGMGDKVLGVSFENLQSLAKKMGRNQTLAEELWKTGVVDARHLATLIADPNTITEATLDAWSRDITYYLLSDMLAAVVEKTMFVSKKLRSWTKSTNEWIGRAGWSLVANVATHDKSLPDSYFEKFLQQVERTIHDCPNFMRHAMNNALIAIGVRSVQLSQVAIDAAKRIGKVEVDHGETRCKTPNAVTYIQRTRTQGMKKPKKSKPRIP